MSELLLFRTIFAEEFAGAEVAELLIGTEVEEVVWLVATFLSSEVLEEAVLIFDMDAVKVIPLPSDVEETELTFGTADVEAS